MVRVMFAVVAIAVLAGVAGCFKTGVGDPEKSKVEQNLVGAWRVEAAPAEGEKKEDGETYWLVRKYDERTYFVQQMKVENRPLGKALGVLSFKGWLTTLGGQQFLVLESLDDSVHFDPDGDGTDFFIARIDIKKDGVTTQMVNGMSEPLKNIAEKKALEKAITENIENAAIFDREKVTYVRAGKADLELIEKLRNAMTSGELRP